MTSYNEYHFVPGCSSFQGISPAGVSLPVSFEIGHHLCTKNTCAFIKNASFQRQNIISPFYYFAEKHDPLLFKNTIVFLFPTSPEHPLWKLVARKEGEKEKQYKCLQKRRNMQKKIKVENTPAINRPIDRQKKKGN